MQISLGSVTSKPGEAASTLNFEDRIFALTPSASVAEYQKRFGETPNQFAADSHDCVYAYKQALETAGCTPDMGTRSSAPL